MIKKNLVIAALIALGMNALCQEGSALTLMPYFRAGFLPVKPTRADATIFTIGSEDVTWEGAVLGGGLELMYDFNRVSPGIDLGYSTVFKNSYEDYDGTRTGNNSMNEFFFFVFADLTLAPNLDMKLGLGGHYTFSRYELWENYGNGTDYEDGFENKMFPGLLLALEKNIPINEKAEVSIALKANPLFSGTDYYWGFMMPVTLNLGYRLKI